MLNSCAPAGIGRPCTPAHAHIVGFLAKEAIPLFSVLSGLLYTEKKMIDMVACQTFESL